MRGIICDDAFPRALPWMKEIKTISSGKLATTTKTRDAADGLSSLLSDLSVTPQTIIYK
jgi:hypothetical protein